MYAQLCKRLSEEAPNFEPPDRPCTFRLLLLNKCKVEFEHRSELLGQYGHRTGGGGGLSMEDEERRQLAKRKMLGNIKFIGELGKLEILSENILHLCIQELLCARRGDDPSEDLECLCQIMRTCGRILDTNKGKGLMDQYFERMAMLADNQDLQPRIRFMLKDIIDLRKDHWAPRKVAVVDGPVPINQIRPADDDRPSYRRDRSDREHRDRDRDNDRSSVPDLFRHPMKTRSGLDEMIMGPLGSLNFNSSSTNLIPTHGFGSNGYGGGGGGNRDGGYRGHNNQRSNFNSFNNQRGQYKHNQNNGSNNYNNQSNKDLAPRFKRNLIVSKEQNLNDLELRPAANSMLFNKPSVKTQNLMNSKTIDHPPLNSTTNSTVAPKPQPPLLTKEPLPIKPVAADKAAKHTKKEKQGATKEEVLKKFASISEEYIKGEATLQQSVESFKEQKVPDKFTRDAVVNTLKTITLEKNGEEKVKFVELLAELRRESQVTSAVVGDGFKALCHLIDECENEKEKITGSLAVMFAAGFHEKLITLHDVAGYTEHGAYYPLFLDTLHEIRQLVSEKELSAAFNDAKIALMGQIPENDRTKERLAQILGEKRLTFLCPMLLLEADLSKQLQADPNPQQFYKWIKENLESIDFNDPGFITALMTVLLKYITQEALVDAGGDDKAITEKEKQLLDRYQPILHAFLHEKPELQLIAVYALQVHFYSLGFPRGQLLRWFNALYDLSIVEEEAFLNWKEDITDVYPGKGQALFQVNQWLTWLQEAESEEEEGDD